MRRRVALACLAAAAAAATSPAAAASSPSARILDYLHARGEALHLHASAVPQPLKVTYIDWRNVDWSAPQQNIVQIADAGFNVAILGFYLDSGPTDMAQAWASVTPAQQNSTIAYAHAQGCVVLVSAGGATEEPYNMDPASYGSAVAAWAVNNSLDGVDFDLENLAPGFTYNGQPAATVINWIVTANAAARGVLGPARLVSHAPQAPYFGAIGGGAGSNPWTAASGGYSAVWAQAAKGGIDFFNMQFYNQGPTCYTSTESLFVASNANASCPSFPGTSVSEIAAYGVPLSVQVIGKPLEVNDAGTGWMSAAALAAALAQARASLGFNTGVMSWSWNAAGNASAIWLATLYPGAGARV
jgi:chitinase